LQYTVNVATAGVYRVGFRVASAGRGGTFHLEMNGANVTGPVSIPDTGGWQNWQTVAATAVLPGGVQTARLVMDSNGLYAVGNFDSMTFGSAATPFRGIAATVPGTIENENFDEGGEGVAYHDASRGNEGGVYRQTDVDLAPNADNTGYVVGWTTPGEWLQYTINVTAAGVYRAGFRVASLGRGGTFHLEIDGANVTGALSIPDTGGWQNWQSVTANVALPAGVHAARLVLDVNGLYAVGNFDSMTFGGVATPYRGTAAAVPGTIENENFDEGGEGVAYHDATPGNAGGVYRQTDVDLAPNATNTGYVVGWASPGEWLNYTVNVAATTSYLVGFSVASLGPGGIFHLEVNGVRTTADIVVPDTGGWQNWKTVTATVPLSAGLQSIRLVLDANGLYAVGNFDWMRFEAAQPVSTPVAPPPPIVTPVSGPAPAGVATSYAAISDRVVRPKPALPSLGTAGFAFTEPTFGTRILRVTDAFTRQTAGLSYRTPSETPNRAWNTTSTRFYVTSTDATIIPYSFDGASMRASRIPGPQDGGLILAFELEPEFSALDPDVIYSRSSQYDHAVVTMYNFATNAYNVVADVRALVPGVDNSGRTYLRGVETGARANVEYMTFAFGGTSQDQDRYVVAFPVGNLGARKLVDTVASTVNGAPTNVPLGFHVHAVAIDQSGRFVSIGPTQGDITAGKAPNYIWDTVTNTFTPLTRSPGGHAALGFGIQVNNPDDSDAMDFMVRDLTAPDSTRLLIAPLPMPRDFSVSSHATWNNAQPSALVPVVAGMFRYGGDARPWREWDEEIVAIRTDGLESRVWRFAHHRSDYNHNGPGDTNAFWYTPRPNVSPDGRWAIFTSNWEKTLGDDVREVNKRQDVFLVELR
jgi:hypothetical protein